MGKGTVRLLMVLSLAAFLAGGCAKKEMIRGEEAPGQPKGAEVQPAPAEQKPAVKEEQPQEAPKPSAVAPPQAVAQEPIKEPAETAPVAAELEKIYFDYDSFTLSPQARGSLEKGAAYLTQKNRDLKIQIEGHCDERGSDEYNMALGERRAKSVHDYLVTLGVPAARLSIISYGEEKPADPGHDEAAWAKNRRVEFNVVR